MTLDLLKKCNAERFCGIERSGLRFHLAVIPVAFGGAFIQKPSMIALVFFTDIYVDTGNPYKQGPLVAESFFVDKVKDHSPLRSLVYYPTSPGQYGVFFFVTGFNGIAVLEFYKGFLEGVAQHG
ncbi:hypothetical protein C0Q70_04571 [Pomacea canaliculata]|uniref:Uncharacterized protein n=1 Tax=Pomacea canaliculata TaxID=400727 RepID=A0A2T7PIS3_POMCA|nr:hypothetical protein C0Q70_04571 [Pomacea canaliculata]